MKFLPTSNGVTPVTLISGVDGQYAKLAADIAAKLLPLKEILKNHGITGAELKILLGSQQFRHQITDFRREWNSPLSAKDRVRLKTSLMVEDALPELYTMFYDTDLAPAARLDAFKKMVDLADMAPKATDNAHQGPKFSLTLNLGNDNQKSVTIDATAEEVDDDG